MPLKVFVKSANGVAAAKKLGQIRRVNIGSLPAFVETKIHFPEDPLFNKFYSRVTFLSFRFYFIQSFQKYCPNTDSYFVYLNHFTNI